MEELREHDETPAQTPRVRRSTGRGDAFVYSGVAFELLGASAESMSALGAQQLACIGQVGGGGALPFASVSCAVREDLPYVTPRGDGRDIRWVRDGVSLEITTTLARITMRETAPRHYAATARVTPHSGVGAALTAITTSLVEQMGGLVLHASGIELDGRAVLFIGPSGAGKTTACNHIQSARGFAWDRAAIVPDEHGWRAWTLPGGDEITLPWSEHASLPLAAIFRVRRGGDAPRIVEARGVEALLALRESSLTGATTELEEAACLARIATVAAAVRVGFAYTRVGEPLDAMLRTWLDEAAR